MLGCHILHGSLVFSYMFCLDPNHALGFFDYATKSEIGKMVRFSFIFSYLLHVSTRLLLTVVSHVQTFSSSQLSPTPLLSALSLFLLVSLFQLMALPPMPSPKLETWD